MAGMLVSKGFTMHYEKREKKNPFENGIATTETNSRVIRDRGDGKG